MAGAFFTEVAEPIPFGGLDSTDPLAFKVYEPDRLVLGKRMEDHLRPGVCFWHSFAWPGIGHVRRRARSTGRGSSRRGDEMDAARARRWPPRSSSSPSSARPYYCFHDRDVAPEGATLRGRSGPTSTRSSTTPPATRSGPASGCCGAPPTCSRIRATRPAPRPTPIPRSSPTPRRRSSTCSRSPSGWAARTTSCGAAARATTRCSTPTCGARATSSPGSCTWSPSTSTRSASQGTLLIEPKPMEPTKHQYDYDVRDRPRLPASRTASRASTRSTSRPTTPRWPATASTTRSRSPSRNGILGSIDANRGDPQNGWDTDQFPNSVEDLALPLYEILRAGGLAPGGFNFDAKLRRQSIDRTDLFHAHIGGLDTLARALLVAAAIWSRTASWPRPRTRATPAGTASSGRSILGGVAEPGRPRGARRRGRDRPGSACRAARSGSRTSSTAHRSGPPDR